MLRSTAAEIQECGHITQLSSAFSCVCAWERKLSMTLKRFDCVFIFQARAPKLHPPALPNKKIFVNIPALKVAVFKLKKDEWSTDSGCESNEQEIDIFLKAECFPFHLLIFVYFRKHVLTPLFFPYFFLIYYYFYYARCFHSFVHSVLNKPFLH